MRRRELLRAAGWGLLSALPVSACAADGAAGTADPSPTVGLSSGSPAPATFAPPPSLSPSAQTVPPTTTLPATDSVGGRLLQADVQRQSPAAASVTAKKLLPVAALYRAALTGDGNAVLSPYSIVTALGMLALGARGTTAQQLAKVLGGDAPTVARWLGGVDAALARTVDASAHSLGSAPVPAVIAPANAVFVGPGSRVLPGALLPRRYRRRLDCLQQLAETGRGGVGRPDAHGTGTDMTAMRLTHARTLTLFCVAAGLTMLSLTACSGSTPANSASAPPSTQTATTQPLSVSTIQSSESLLPSTPTTAMTQSASGGDAPKAATASPDLATKGCSAISLAGVRALVKAAVTKVDFDPGSAELDPAHSFRCDVDNPTLLITIYPEDASQHTYDQDVAAENVPAVPLTGVGTAAVWTAVSLTPGNYTAAPDVYAHQGPITCEVQGSGDGLTIPFEPGPIPAITKANVAAFAAKLGVFCNDIFAALA